MTDSTSTSRPHEEGRLSNALGDLLGVGVAWARYGLGIGSAALETSALTLKTTARTLEAISEKLTREHAEAAAGAERKAREPGAEREPAAPEGEPAAPPQSDPQPA